MDRFSISEPKIYYYICIFKFIFLTNKTFKIMKFTPLAFASAFIFTTILSCQKDKPPFPNSEPLKIDSTSMELVWEKPLDSNFQNIKIFPFAVEENIIHTYDFGLDQILVYRDGKTGEEIKRINFYDILYPTNGAVINDKLVIGAIKKVIVVEPKTGVTRFVYNSHNEFTYLNERFKTFGNFVITNEYSFLPQDSIDRIIAANVKDNTSKVLWNEKNHKGKNLLGNAHLWIDELGDTLLTVGKTNSTGWSSPSNLLTFNLSKNVLLYDKQYSFVNHTNDFICFNNKIYLVSSNNTVMCIEGKNGNFLWEYNHNGSKSIGSLEVNLVGNQLVIVGGYYKASLLSLDPETGKLLWANNDIIIYHDDTKLLLIDNIIYFGKDDYIYGIDKNSGVLLKKQRITNLKNHLIAGLSYSEKNKLIYAIDSSFIKALKIK